MMVMLYFRRSPLLPRRQLLPLYIPPFPPFLSAMPGCFYLKEDKTGAVVGLPRLLFGQKYIGKINSHPPL